MKPLNWTHVTTLISVMILIGVEVFGVAFAAGWALAGMFELSQVWRWTLMGTFGALGLFAMQALWRVSVKVEPLRT